MAVYRAASRTVTNPASIPANAPCPVARLVPIARMKAPRIVP